MKKTFLIWLLATVFLATSASAQAQPAKRIYRLGYLSATDVKSDAQRAQAVRSALRELGYVEGENLAIEFRHADGKPRQPELAADLARLKVEAILVAGGDVGIQAAIAATKTIPIVLTGFGSDPVKAGWVQSLARPGGNVTGMTNYSTVLGGKRLELLKEALPKTTLVAVLYNPDSPGVTREVKEDLPAAARALKLTVQPWEVRVAGDFEKIFAALTKQRPDAVYAPTAGAVMTANQKRIVGFALKQKLPSMFPSPSTVEAGGLLCYSPDDKIRYQRVAYYVDRILKGAKPADLPIEQPTNFEFVINLKTANQIGVTIAPEVLARATRIIR